MELSFYQQRHSFWKQ